VLGNEKHWPSAGLLRLLTIRDQLPSSFPMSSYFSAHRIGMIAPVIPRGRFRGLSQLTRCLRDGNVFSMRDMKMLCSSRDRFQIDLIREQLVAAGIRCEVRSLSTSDNDNGITVYTELWVEANADYHTASILYASPLRVLRQRAHDLRSVS